MRLPLANKVFFVFFSLSVTAFAVALTVFLELNNLERSQERIRVLNDYLFQVKTLQAFTRVGGPAVPVEDESGFDTAFEKARQLAESIRGYGEALDPDLQRQVASLVSSMGHYRDAYKELQQRRARDREFARLDQPAGDPAGQGDPGQDPAGATGEEDEVLEQLRFLRLKAYLSRDLEQVQEMKRLVDASPDPARNPALQLAFERLVQETEENYINYLAMRERREFLQDSANQFIGVTNSTLLALRHHLQHSQAQLQQRVYLLLAFSVLLTVLLWYFVNRYFRRFLSGQHQAIEAIRAENYDYPLAPVAQDEIGDLAVLLKGLATKLQSSREFFATTLNNLQSFIFVLDLQGRVVFANTAALRMAGLSLAEIKGSRFTEGAWLGAAAPEGLSPEACLQRCAAGETLACETRWQSRELGPIWVDFRLHPLLDGAEGEGYLVLEGSDISDAKTAAIQLGQSESLLRTTLDSTADGILVVDPEGRVISFNQRFRQLWGIPDALLQARDDAGLLAFVTDQLVDPEAFVAEVQRLYASEEIASDNILFKDGRVFERYTVPLRIPSGLGRVWSFRDITEKERTLDALEHEKGFLKTLVQTLPALVWLKDEAGRYLACNPLFERLYGHAEAEILGRDDYDFVDRDLADFFREHDREAIAKGQPSVNEEWLTFASDGYRGLFETIKTPMYARNGDLIGVLGIARDITEQRQRETDLNESESRWRRLVENVPDVLYRFSIKRGGVYYSPQVEAVFGCSRTHLYAHPFLWAESIHPDDKERVAHAIEGIRQDQPFSIEYRVQDVQGRWHWLYDRCIHIHHEGEELFIEGLAMEITRQKEAEQSILEGGQRYQAVIASSKDGYWLVDTRGRLLEVNDSYCAHSGYAREELLSLSVSDLDIEDSPEQARERIEQMMQSGGAIFQTTHRRKDGSLWPVEVSISYSPVQGGRFFSFLRDISERRANEQLGQLRQQLADMVYTHDQPELLQTALDLAERLTESQIGFFHFVEKDQETVSLQTWSTRTLKEMCFAKGEGLHYPVSEAGVWVDCIHRREPVIHNDYAALAHRKGLPEGHAPVVRELTVPVLRENRIVAVVGVGNKPRDYDDDDIALVTRLADMTYDFIERKRAEQQIQFMAFNDVLTGLPNRQLFADRLRQAISLARRSKKLLAIGYLDLDGFKPVNDRLGHEAGDQLLVQLAHRLQVELREGDTLARLGGDEFVVLLNELGSIIQGEEIVERLLRAIAQPFEIGGNRLHISASIGVTFYPHDNSDPDTLLRHADQAMYKAKAGGKNSFSLYDPVQDAKVHALRQAIGEFEQALHRSQLLLHYQPRIDLRSGELAGVEALVRWQHPHKGLLYPDQFLPLIEDSPLEIALDEWVLRAAIAQHLRWREDGLYLPVSVNLSPRHIQQESFPRYLEKVLADAPDDLSRFLELEVLETGAIGDTAHVAEIMNACAAFGVQFSLDDFGTGYSSLTYFHRLPISVLKIDQHFVRAMLDDARDQDIVEGVLRLADALDRPVVAEGVETIELGMMLAQLGCQYAQGYGIARPMPPEAVPVWSGQWLQESPWHQLHTQALGPTGHYDLNVSIFSHRLWLEKIRAHLHDGAERPELDESHCPFAHWYRGIGATRYGGRPTYPFILHKHDEAHRLARTLLDATEQDGAQDLENPLQALETASAELEAMLQTLGTE